jgi:hypothetical protein
MSSFVQPLRCGKSTWRPNGGVKVEWSVVTVGSGLGIVSLLPADAQGALDGSAGGAGTDAAFAGPGTCSPDCERLLVPVAQFQFHSRDRDCWSLYHRQCASMGRTCEYPRLWLRK